MRQALERVTAAALASALAAVLAVGCGSEEIAIADIPVPIQATDTTVDGSYEVRLDAALGEILAEVPGLADGADERLLALAPGTTIVDVVGFYEAELDDGFVADGEPVTGNNNERAVWRDDGRIFVAAVVDAGEDAEGEPLRFLALFLSR
jgi:hypothetical protein